MRLSGQMINSTGLLGFSGSGIEGAPLQKRVSSHEINTILELDIPSANDADNEYECLKVGVIVGSLV